MPNRMVLASCAFSSFSLFACRRKYKSDYQVPTMILLWANSVKSIINVLSMAFLALSVGGCSIIESEKKSLFFNRLLESATKDQYRSLLQEADSRDLHSQIRDLQSDGFKIITGRGTPPSEGLDCGEYFAARSTSSGQDVFTMRLHGGGFFSDWYRIDILISIDCSIVDVSGMVMPQAL